MLRAGKSLWLGLGALSLIVFIAAVGVVRWRYPPVPGFDESTVAAPVFASLDSTLRDRFADASQDDPARFRVLFEYLLTGYLSYRTESGARAHYPGWPSNHGRDVDGLEGFARMAPLLAAWLAGGRPDRLALEGRDPVSLTTLLSTGLAAGTDPAHPAYWGDLRPGGQRLVEAADVALALCLLRDSLWPTLPVLVREQTLAWLQQAQGQADEARFSNYRLFPLLINRVRKALGDTVSEEAFESDWTALWAAYRGEGWFERNATEAARFDYYHAWAYHYSLYWLERIDPDAAGPRVGEAREAFVAFYRHLMTPTGFPILGRSICYRMAAPAPLIAAALAGSAQISPGQARRALATSWEYFIARGAVAHGGITQGYCAADRRIVDRYSGPASCLWAARSLILALSAPDAAPLWRDPQAPLPVELGDFEVLAEIPNWRVTGEQATGIVRLRQLDRRGSPPLREIKRRQAIAMALLNRPFGPGNRGAKYLRATYANEPPFCGCPQEAVQP